MIETSLFFLALYAALLIPVWASYWALKKTVLKALRPEPFLGVSAMIFIAAVLTVVQTAGPRMEVDRAPVVHAPDRVDIKPSEPFVVTPDRRGMFDTQRLP